jgi:hypothetical protein
VAERALAPDDYRSDTDQQEEDGAEPFAPHRSASSAVPNRNKTWKAWSTAM